MTTATAGVLKPQMPIHDHKTAQIFAPALGRELEEQELDEVSGGRSNDQVYETALGVAVGFATAAVALSAGPVVIGALTLGSLGSSAVAIFSQISFIRKY
ncbi:MAG: hypothetical protein ACR2PZ_16410 [Pseudomonadales bacterium]